MTPTTIQGVSILSAQEKRGQDVFDIALSREGIEVRRPERPASLMSWDRISEWEIEERKGYVLLTLRGQGATTPLVVPGWKFDDLEILMRDITANGTSNHRATALVPEPAVEAEAEASPTRAERRQRSEGGSRRRRVPWKAVATVSILGVLATAVILVLLQSAGIIDWSFLGPVA